MAKLNLNSVLCNVQANDNVVAARMGIGSQLSLQTAAILSHGRPVSPGPDMPEPRGGIERALAYRDASATRIGRSVSPAGCCLRSGLGLTARSARLVELKRQVHEWQGFDATLVKAKATQKTGSR
jgi:hypothetical protein